MHDDNFESPANSPEARRVDELSYRIARLRQVETEKGHDPATVAERHALEEELAQAIAEWQETLEEPQAEECPHQNLRTEQTFRSSYYQNDYGVVCLDCGAAALITWTTSEWTAENTFRQTPPEKRLPYHPKEAAR